MNEKTNATDMWKKVGAILVLVVLVAILGKVISDSNLGAKTSEKEAAVYSKGDEVDIAFNNRDNFLGRLAMLGEMIKGKPKDQCFDLVFMYWQDFEQRFNQGKYAYLFKFQLTQGAEGVKFISIGQLPQKMCGIASGDAEEMFKQRRLLAAKLGAGSVGGSSSATDSRKAAISNSQNDSYATEPEVVLLQGRLISAPGETPDGESVSFPALELASPIIVKADQNHSEAKDVGVMQLVLDEKTRLQYEAMKGKQVSVRGSLFHRDFGTQYTWVLMTPAELVQIRE